MAIIRDDHPDVEAAVIRALSSGGVVVVPTDTLYGFSTAMSSREGHVRIGAMKGDAADRRYLYLADSVDRVEAYIDDWGCAGREILERIWPAPLTGIFRSGSQCPGWTGGTIAFRIPSQPLIRGVVEGLGEPVLSTSVNEAGKPPLGDPRVIERKFGALVDVIVDGGRLRASQPSTLVDFTGSAPFVVRQGAYVWRGGGNPSN